MAGLRVLSGFKLALLNLGDASAIGLFNVANPSQLLSLLMVSFIETAYRDNGIMDQTEKDGIKVIVSIETATKFQRTCGSSPYR